MVELMAELKTEKTELTVVWLGPAGEQYFSDLCTNWSNTC